MSFERKRCLISEILMKILVLLTQKLKAALLVLPPPTPPPPKAHIWHINIYKLKLIYNTKKIYNKNLVKANKKISNLTIFL